MNNTRSIFGVILLLAVIFGFAPLVLILGFIGVFRFKRFWELLVAGFLFELLYGVGGWHLPFLFPMFTGAVLLFVLGEFIRRKLR